MITAPNGFDVPGLRVFLGGAIDAGEAPDWQADVAQALAGRKGLVLLNPRRPTLDPAELDDQITWELAALDAAHIIMMWFPANTVAPIALLETGLYLASGKIVIGAAEGYWRRRNLELVAVRHGVPLLDRLADLVAFVADRCGEG